MNAVAPVAFFSFNRPEKAKQVLEQIRHARPERLLVATDGPRPRHPTDEANCAAVRQLVEKMIDWPCELTINHSGSNLGCRLRISSALDWVFSLVSEAIILEDDCVPHPDFFPFCTEMLATYRSDKRVMHINGTNVAEIHSPPQASHFFSIYSLPWGWASWRRAWRHYDVCMSSYESFEAEGGVRRLFRHPLQRAYFENMLRVHTNPNATTWDWQWIYSVWKEQGYAVTSASNLICNIGDDGASTHSEANPFCRLPIHAWRRGVGDERINERYDRCVFEEYFSGGKTAGIEGWINTWKTRVIPWRKSLALRTRLRRLVDAPQASEPKRAG